MADVKVECKIHFSKKSLTLEMTCETENMTQSEAGILLIEHGLKYLKEESGAEIDHKPNLRVHS